MSAVTLDPGARPFDARQFAAYLQDESANPSFDESPSPAPAVNRRLHRRFSPEQCQWLTIVRVKYGSDVRVIDVSAGGMQIEVDEPFEQDAKRVFELVGPDSTIVAPARILRCEKAAASAGRARYRCAVSFARPLTLPDPLAGPTRQAKKPEPRTARPAAAPAPTPRPIASSPTPTHAGGLVGGAIWQKVVARFVTGEVVRGYSSNFHTSRTQLHIADHPTSTKPTLVSLDALKAIFFVRDFEGDPKRTDRTSFVGAPAGRKIKITFNDGEVLVGATMSYQHTGTGFFVQPADPRSNNLRVFVVLAAVASVQFLS